MHLKLETVRDTLKNFAEMYGAPRHVKEPAQMDSIIRLYHRELSKHFSEEDYPKAETFAFTKARDFPRVADFFEGFGKADVDPELQAWLNGE